MSELNFKNIATGFYKNIMNKEEELYNSRIKICKKCPLLKINDIFGMICDPSKYINDKDEVSKEYKPGFIKGCGCVLSSKTRLQYEQCIINKW